MSRSDIESLFAQTGIWRYGSLREAGIGHREIARAVEEQVVLRPVFRRHAGPVPGILVSPQLNQDPYRDWIIATFVTGGVIGRHTAGRHYSYSTSMQGGTEVHVRDSYSRVPPQLIITTMRSRNEDMRRLGVESIETEYGVEIPITNKARTLVDLLHSGRGDDRDHEHALDGLATFFEEGGEPWEVTSLASDLGLDWDGKVALTVQAVESAMGARGPSRC